jgi:hypothetical protein
MTTLQRKKLLAERKDLERLRRLYKKHAITAISAIRKCDKRIMAINLSLGMDELRRGDYAPLENLKRARNG